MTFTPDRPLRVLVVGSGPSGVFAADALIKQTEVPVQVDVLDRLPTPYGLVRYGVAPDHLKIKSVTAGFERTLSDPRVRFLGNVAFGTDLTYDEAKAQDVIKVVPDFLSDAQFLLKELQKRNP